MKKLALLAIVVAFGATACKKDYKCTCDTSSMGITLSGSQALGKVKKKDAEDACKKLQDAAAAVNAGSDVTTTCKAEKA